MSQKAVDWAWDVQVPPMERYVLLHICALVNSKNKVSISLRDLHKKVGMARCTLTVYLRKLAKKKLVVISGFENSPHRMQHIYHVAVGNKQFQPIAITLAEMRAKKLKKLKAQKDKESKQA